MSLPLSGTTRVAAVIGSPVRHSLSPAIHNAAFAALDLDWTYLAFDVARGEARSAIEAMRALHLGGLSVTMPHKADVVSAVDRLTTQAQDLDAVNCVAWDAGELVGHNTDGGGFLDSLEIENGITVSGQKCYVAGAGGAARAVVKALAEAGAVEIIVANRTRPKAVSTAALGGGVARVGTSTDVETADIIVNATSVGMTGPSPAGACPVDVGMLNAQQVVVDLVYHPMRTPLIEAAEAVGATTVGGIAMLVHQAARQFELWTGHKAPLEAMSVAANNAIEAS